MRNDHYYTRVPQSESKPVDCEYSYRGVALSFRTDAGVFSRGELDAGTRILLSALPDQLSGRVLDLGCGWGPVGVCVKTIWPACEITFADINSRAMELSKANAQRYGIQAEFVQSDGFAEIEGAFDCIITNPPIRAGKKTIYKMFSDGKDHLRPGGCLYLVIRKQQGAPSALQYLSQVYARVDVIDKSGGYWVICCRKE